MKIKHLLLVATVLAFSISLVLFFRYRWQTLDYYLPHSKVVFSTPFRTMAEHNAFMQGKQWPYIIKHDTAKSALLYYGSRHTTDPNDPQIQQIQQLWTAFQPTVAVTENRLGFFVGGMKMGVKVFGEFGTVFGLARRDKIPIYTLEPPWKVEVSQMKAAFPTEEVTLFYTLRVFFSERNRVKPAKIDSLAAELLRKRGGRDGLEGSLPDLASLDALWEEKFSHLGPWRELSESAIWPSATPTRLQKLSNLANEIRDRHAARVIIDLLSQGHRVFAIAGGSHVVKQEPVIRAVFP